MNKTPVITIIAMLAVMLIIFSSCEFSVALDGSDNTETSVEEIVVTDEEGNTHIETVVHNVTTEKVPVVTVVEVTNKKGKVVSTEKVTLSPDEVQQGKDFFGKTDGDATTTVSNKPAADRVTTAPSKDNVAVQDDYEILNSSKYLIEGRVVTADGTSYPYKLARDGNRFTFRSAYGESELCVIVGASDVYLLSPDTKTYTKVSKSLIAEKSDETEDFEDLLSGDAFNLYANKTQVDSYTEKMYGVKYRVIEYDDGTLDYLNGKTLVMTVASDGSTLYYDTVSSNVSEGLFIPPSDYKEEVLTSERVSEIAGSLSTTDAHNHKSSGE